MNRKVLTSLLMLLLIISLQVYSANYERFDGVCDRNQRVEVIEAESSRVQKGGSWAISPNGQTLWLLGNGAWARVTSTVPSDVVYIQYDGSDYNDGYTHIYVDDLPAYSYCTRNLGNHYVRISGLPNTTHTIRVVSDGNCNNSTDDHNHLGFFAFGDLPTPTPTITPTPTLTPTPPPIPIFNNLGIFILLGILTIILIRFNLS